LLGGCAEHAYLVIESFILVIEEGAVERLQIAHREVCRIDCHHSRFDFVVAGEDLISLDVFPSGSSLEIRSHRQQGFHVAARQP